VVYNYNTSYIPVIAKYRESQNIKATIIVYNRELEGITRAIKYTSNKAKKEKLFNIYINNQASLLRLKTSSNKPGQS
jgi:hypothetical protein